MESKALEKSQRTRMVKFLIYFFSNHRKFKLGQIVWSSGIENQIEWGLVDWTPQGNWKHEIAVVQKEFRLSENLQEKKNFNFYYG